MNYSPDFLLLKGTYQPARVACVIGVNISVEELFAGISFLFLLDSRIECRQWKT